MNLQQAAEIVLGTKPTNAVQYYAARQMMFEAAQQGFKFATRGSAANPVVIVKAPQAA